MSALWTSQEPDRHRSETSFSARLPADRLTLAELLSAQGVHTAGFVANAVAGRAFGFERGFSEFHEVFRESGSSAESFREPLGAFLERFAGGRLFLYVHFREPHFPYDPPTPFDTRFGAEGPIPGPARSDSAWITAYNSGERPLSPEEREHLVRLYDGNLAHADAELGRLRRSLEAAGMWERMAVIVLADHGEELGEHGWIGHNVHLYEPSVRVPLILKLPGWPGGRRVPGLADLRDVAPTVADLFGVMGQGGSERAFEGRSLLPQVAGAPGRERVLSRTVWDRPRYALRDAGHKFVYDTRSGESRLFDLRADPEERNDRAAAEPLRAAYYREEMYLELARLARRPRSESAARLTREQCENLRALGYLDADCELLLAED
jgi:arylsulfatase A-like enzyme